MFHPTIGQSAHQSLNNTATPELGMIPQGIRGNLARSCVAKDTQQYIAKPTKLGLSGYRELETLAAKLVGSLKR